MAAAPDTAYQRHCEWLASMRAAVESQGARDQSAAPALRGGEGDHLAAGLAALEVGFDEASGLPFYRDSSSRPVGYAPEADYEDAPVYRSLGSFGSGNAGTFAVECEDYEEAPVYRSLSLSDTASSPEVGARDRAVSMPAALPPLLRRQNATRNLLA